MVEILVEEVEVFDVVTGLVGIEELDDTLLELGKSKHMSEVGGS